MFYVFNVIEIQRVNHFLVYVEPHRKILTTLASICQLRQEGDRLHQSVCCRHIRPSASQW